MKNQQWLSNIENALFVSRNRQTRRKSRYSNRFQFQQLEAKNLLASVAFDGDSGIVFTAESGQADSVIVSEASPGVLQIQVGNGDSITTPSDNDSPFVFEFSQNVLANDTVQISGDFSVDRNSLTSFNFFLGDQDDIFEARSLPLVRLVVFGEAGNDTINGGDRPDLSDQLFGGDGDDTIDGDGGNDRIDGGAGNDLIFAGEGQITIDGGAGIDELSFERASFGVTLSIVNDDGVGSATNRDARINAAGFSGIENLTGSVFDDILTGNDLNNVIAGGEGNDLIDANGGDDTITGGAGDDIINGGTGIDSVDGGEGVDDNLFSDADCWGNSDHR